MNSEQICYLLLENAQNEGLFDAGDHLDSFQYDPLRAQGDGITSRLYQILHSLQEQKNLLISTQLKQQEIAIQKIHKQKDQIIEDLLKNIYNLKKQNQQLKFQYRKRFKVIKNISQKYQTLILNKNTKITSLHSVVKYLEGKIKYLEKKLANFHPHFKIEFPTKNPKILQKKPQTYFSPNNIALIVSEENPKFDLRRNFPNTNCFQDLTMPHTSSFVSLSKVTSSSKTIQRKRSKQDHKENRLSNFLDLRQSDIHSSFMAFTDKNSDELCVQTETNFEENSRINPFCVDSHSSVATSKYLTLQDLNDLQSKELVNQQISKRKSQQFYSSVSRDRWNILREKY